MGRELARTKKGEMGSHHPFRFTLPMEAGEGPGERVRSESDVMGDLVEVVGVMVPH